MQFVQQKGSLISKILHNVIVTGGDYVQYFIRISSYQKDATDHCILLVHIRFFMRLNSFRHSLLFRKIMVCLHPLRFGHKKIHSFEDNIMYYR